MRVQVNGSEHLLADGASVSDLIRSLDLRSDRVAVEHNREIVGRATFPERSLAEGDEIEIVTLVGGG